MYIEMLLQVYGSEEISGFRDGTFDLINFKFIKIQECHGSYCVYVDDLFPHLFWLLEFVWYIITIRVQMQMQIETDCKLAW